MFGIIKDFKIFLKKIKNPWWKAKKKYIKYYDDLPINDKTILIESQQGKEMSGNVFYLMRYLSTSEKYRDYTIYLSARLGKTKLFRGVLDSYGLNSIKLTVLASEEYYMLMASAKYLINDNTFMPFFIKKEGQVYLNTWHGTPLKALGKQVKSDAHAIGNAQKNFIFADYLLFPNEHTRNAILDDYMVRNISDGSYIMAGYPRNEVFFDSARADEIREEIGAQDKRLYAYMPTFRGGHMNGGTQKNTHYLNYYLYELDDRLEDNEILYVNLHPVATKDVNFRDFKHIRSFPSNYETYDFLGACDILVTDYSSVFFDYAASRKKVVLFTYDEKEYLKDRGMYMSLDELPFPKAADINELLAELRSPKSYDDTKFLERFCKYEGPDASRRLCDFVILGESNGITAEKIPTNGKKNVLIYSGNLATNGVTSSLMSLLSTVDTKERNYYITASSELLFSNRHVLHNLPEGVNYLITLDDAGLTISEQIRRKLFKKKKISAKSYMKKQKHRIEQDFKRNYAGAKFDTVIQFNGYEPEIILGFSVFDGNRIIFVHSDMLEEMRTRGNQRRDVLEYAYRTYDKVAVVTDSLIEPTLAISGRRDNIVVVRNTINHRAVLEKGNMPLDEPDYTECTVSFEDLKNILASQATKLISIGRFGPEKGHIRLIDAFSRLLSEKPNSYLFIIGGSSYSGYYEKTKAHIEELGLADRVILILRTPNPYRILSMCDGFILSSLYEGFGLVLAEADILGKPVVSTDISGPRLFMKKHGGTMVESSEDGILEGMRMLADGKVKPLNVDYAQYNREVVEEFESLFK